MRTPAKWAVALTVALAGCAGPGIRPTAVVVTTPATTTTSTSATTTPVITTTTTTIPEPTRITVAFSGDLLSHSPVYAQARRNGGPELAYDYRPMFGLISDIVSDADLAICHLETPLSADNSDLSGYPTFAAPKELAVAIADAGYDGCSTASNHSYDRGPSGIAATLDALDRAGLGHAGMSRSADEWATPSIYEVDGVAIGHMSFTYGLNGFLLPDTQPWLVDVTSSDSVLAKARATREAGADIVILSIQWGVEYQTDPTQEQLDLAREFLASPDIDLIVGSHAHVVQPLDQIDGKYVLYGLGNFLSNQSANCCPARTQNGVIALFTFEGTDQDGYRVVEVDAVPTRVDRTDYTIVPLPRAVTTVTDAGTRSTLEAALNDTIEILTRRGVDIDV